MTGRRSGRSRGRAPEPTFPAGDAVADTPFDMAVEVLMATMLLFLPLAFGGTQAWSREVWYALVVAMALCVLVRRVVYRDAAIVLTWAYVPIALFVALVLLQATPLPAGVVRWLSPGAVRTRQELLGDAAGVQTITLYPEATWQHLQMVLAVSAVFAVVLHAYRSTERVRRLLSTMTLAGLAVAAVAAYQDATGATLIYGVVPIGHKNAGPFQNYSHFSQFMNLSVGAALALILMTLAEWAAWEADDVWDRLRRPSAWPVWAAGVLCVAGPVLVLWSMSRMGMISLLTAGGATAALLGARAGRGGDGRAGGHSFLIIGLGLAVFAVLLAVGFDFVYDRLATLAHTNAADGGRWRILKDLVPLWRRFPVLGTGLGTHEFVFPAYDHRDSPQIATHAENEYAQLLEECGGVGLALALAFLGLLVAAFMRATRRPQSPGQYAVFGLGSGLLAVLLHSATDFGQHVPACATLTAVVAAVVINVADARRPTARAHRRPAIAPGRLLPVTAMAAVAVVAGPFLWSADTQRRAETAYLDAREADARLTPDSPDEACRSLLANAAEAAALRPSDVTYAYWLNAWRWQVIARGADRRTGQLDLSEAVVTFSRRLVSALDAMRPLCPTFGPALSLSGQIRLNVLQDAAGEADVRAAYRLTPYDRSVCRVMAEALSREGDWPAAVSAFKKYVRLGGSKRDVILALAAADRPHLAYEFAADDRDAVEALAASTADPRWAAFCRAQADHLLRLESDRPDAAPDLLMARGKMHQKVGRTTDALLWYQRAVEGDYGRADWRLTLAKTLAEVGRYDDAARELQICLRLRPNLTEAEQLRAAYAAKAAGAPTTTP